MRTRTPEGAVGAADEAETGLKRAASALCRDCLRLLGFGEGGRCGRCGSPRVARHDELEGLSLAHLDCDAFYASVEKRDRPELQDVPVIVGGGVRGVVTTCCYIARTFGVSSAMPMFKALRACPEAVVIRPDFPKYKRESRRIMALLRTLTPLVQPLALDEAWLDLGGTERLNDGCPALVLARAQARIERETGLTVSVGLAPNKFLAKVASEFDKPRGFSVIGRKEARSVLAPRSVRVLPGVGPVFAAALERGGFGTVGHLADADVQALQGRFGASGARLARLARGEDLRDVEADGRRKSISAESTFLSDLRDRTELEDRLWPLCEGVSRQARAEGVGGRTVTLKLKTDGFRLLTRSRTLPMATQTSRLLYETALDLLRPEADGVRSYRLIGAGLSGLVDVERAEPGLFEDRETRARLAETAMDRLRDRFGDGAVVSGRALRAGGRRGPTGGGPRKVD